MKIIVGNMSHKLREFIKKYHFTSKIIVINKMCNVKTIKGEVDIIIPFAKIEPNGLITNTQVHFEELLMSVNVKSIKYGNPHAKSSFEEIAHRYGIIANYLDLNNIEHNTAI